MNVLLVTRSDDNESVDRVAAALLRRRARPFRLDTDLYPQRVRLTTGAGDGGARRVLTTAAGRIDLAEVGAVWYRRFFAGGRLPAELGDLREPCVEESRRALLGAIAALDGRQVDRWVCVREAELKELQLARAAAEGLAVPRTVVTNDPAEARRFFRARGGRVVAKMQTSFAVEREGREQVVFTTPVRRQDLRDARGLSLSPVVFQERLDKRRDVRATVVGGRVFAAAVDSQRRGVTRVDWRRDGVGLLGAWKPYRLPADVDRALVRLVASFGLHYAAADLVCTRDGRHVFLEINPGGEWFWLARRPGLPIAEAIADVLVGRTHPPVPPA